LLDIEFIAYSGFLRYKIDEGIANIKYGTVDNWSELANCVQPWINYIQQNADIIYSNKPGAEKIERKLKVLIDGQLQDAIFSMYRNRDWDIEKFRGAYLSIGENNYCVINTYTGVEDLLIDLDKSLPQNISIQSCLFCKYSHYHVAGNDNFGDLNCFKHCKEKCAAVKTKKDLIDLFETEFSKSQKVEETFYCENFKAVEKNDFIFKSIQ
jgi:hypothetical protein